MKDLQWEAWVDCEKNICATFMEACNYIANYLEKNTDTLEDLYHRVWIEFGGEVISLSVISRVISEIKVQ